MDEKHEGETSSIGDVNKSRLSVMHDLLVRATKQAKQRSLDLHEEQLLKAIAAISKQITQTNYTGSEPDTYGLRGSLTTTTY